MPKDMTKQVGAKTNLATLCEEIRKQSEKEKPGSGLSRGSLFKLGFEHFEKNEGKSPSPEEKEAIRKAIQVDFNKNGFRQDYEVLLTDKPWKRLSGGKLTIGRNLKFADTRKMSFEREAWEIMDLIRKHQDKKAKEPLYGGSETEKNKTDALERALNGCLYHLESGNEKKQRIEAQMKVWFPAKVTPAEQAISNMTSVVEVSKELVEA